MTDQSPAVLYDPAIRPGVALVTLNRPKKLNAWNGAMAVGFSEALHDAAENPKVRVIVVTGAGRGLCGGADLNDTQNFPGLKKDGAAAPQEGSMTSGPQRPVL